VGDVLPYGVLELIGDARHLGDECGGAYPQGGIGHAALVLGGEYDDHHARVGFAGLTHKPHACSPALAKDDLGDHHGWALGGECELGVLDIRDLDDGHITKLLELLASDRTDILLLVDEQDFQLWHSSPLSAAAAPGSRAVPRPPRGPC